MLYPSKMYFVAALVFVSATVMLALDSFAQSKSTLKEPTLSTRKLELELFQTIVSKAVFNLLEPAEITSEQQVKVTEIIQVYTKEYIQFRSQIKKLRSQDPERWEYVTQIARQLKQEVDVPNKLVTDRLDRKTRAAILELINDDLQKRFYVKIAGVLRPDQLAKVPFLKLRPAKKTQKTLPQPEPKYDF